MIPPEHLLIMVMPFVDLNQMPSTAQPFEKTKAKTFGCFCVFAGTGPLSSTVKLPRLGYVPGEAIPIDAEIENLSDKKMKKTHAILIRKLEFHSSKKGKPYSKLDVEEIKVKQYALAIILFYYSFFLKEQRKHIHL